MESNALDVAALSSLVSESSNPATTAIDTMSTVDILRTINDQDAGVAAAVAATLPDIEQAVERIVHAFQAGGRLIYMGAGTSGRLAVLDASECPPTFGVPPGMVIGIIAGGDGALRKSVEGAEDSVEQGRNDLDLLKPSSQDVVVGIAASGRTPYVIGALQRAREAGACTVALSCNPESPIARFADIAISPVVGPEVIAGSTRLKSGTAQKLVLNMLTTTSMIRIGKTYGNQMVDLSVSNEKLIARGVRMIEEVVGCSTSEATGLLSASGNHVKLGILMGLTGMDKDSATDALDKAGGFLRKAIDSRHPSPGAFS